MEVNELNVEIAMEQNVKMGLMKHAGKDSEGKQLYSITRKGKAFVEAMPFKDALESAEWLKNYKEK